MLKIRLARVGKKKQPTYRVVVADARAARDGAVVEVIGHYNPRLVPKVIEIDAEKARDWMRKGAQPTDTVSRLLKAQGIER
ncbi:MAG TPA: 30S ribosomal protein S16 [Dehalococcoidia bacterium]|nr:30S ribosomal protein S16 [Dehalococcoidia bacterium]